MAIDKTLGLFDGLGIVGTNQWLEPNKVTIAPDSIGSVLCHSCSITKGGPSYIGGFSSLESQRRVSDFNGSLAATIPWM